MPDTQRKKLDSKSTSKVYRLYDPISKKILISRDVIFAETEKWDWKKSDAGKNNEHVELIDDDQVASTEAGHDQGGGEEGDHLDLNNPNDHPTEEEKTANEPATNTPGQTSGRIRGKTVWFDDYVTLENMYTENELHNLAVFSQSEDPTTFEEAVKRSVWRKPMDLEIEAIEKK